jgi:hypothetical protein
MTTGTGGGSSRSSWRNTGMSPSTSVRDCWLPNRPAQPTSGWDVFLGALAYDARRDADDLRLLVDRLGLTSVEQVEAVCTRVFPDETLPDRARLVLADTFGDIGRTDKGDNSR